MTLEKYNNDIYFRRTSSHCQFMGDFLFQLSRTTGAITLIIMSVVCAFISPWSLILGIPLILISLVVMIEPLRMSFISRPAYKALADAMPSISPTEREALDSGTSWWEKNFYGSAQLGNL